MEQAKPYSKLYPGDRYRRACDPRGETFIKGATGDPLAVDSAAETPVLAAREFDYRAAWEDYAKPAWDNLPEHVRAVFLTVAPLTRDMRQDVACRLIGDNASKAFEAMAALDMRELATLAVVAHDVEHWAHGGDPFGMGAKFGQGWRFANLADQELARRAGFEFDRFHREGRGFGFRVIEGQLRAHFSTPDMWTWRELGLCTPENVAALDVIRERFYSSARTAESFEAVCAEAAAEFATRETDATLRALLDPVQAYAPKGFQRHDCAECGTSPLFAGFRANHAAGCSVRAGLVRAEQLAKLAEACTVEVECLPEETPIEGNALASGDDAEDAAEETRIREELESNPWAWCTVRVVASLETMGATFEGEAFLGCASYDGESDFRTGGYFEDLKSEALEALFAKLQSARAAIDALGVRP